MPSNIAKLKETINRLEHSIKQSFPRSVLERHIWDVKKELGKYEKKLSQLAQSNQIKRKP